MDQIIKLWSNAMSPSKIWFYKYQVLFQLWGRNKNNSIIKTSNQNMMVQNVSSQQKPGGPSGQNASAEKPLVDQIVSYLEEASSCQPLR